MYHSAVGKALTSSKAVRAALRALSVREGAFMDSKKSAAGIAAFVAAHKINMADYARSDPAQYATFNDFFTRTLRAGARPVASPGDAAVLVSPADCRLCAFPSAAEATGVWVKGEHFTLDALLGPGNADAAAILRGGQVLVARLAPQDYHRFHCPAGARVLRRTSIEGALFTVNPIAIRQPRPCVYTSNKRVVDVLSSPAFGVFALVAVGATAVGSISMTAPVGGEVERGAELGFFAFGGSTVLVILQEGAAVFDADLVANSRAPLETIVKTGERVGVACAPRGLRHEL
jgi:phosphatidylserine decarboxylase